MRTLRLRLALAALLALPLGAGPLASQRAPVSAPPARPGSELSVFLLTMGQGDQVWEKFGHNALWIHDPVRGTDRVYNYGVFDFNSPGYWSRFVKGNWIYQLAVDDIHGTLAQYRYLNRTLVAQELNLTPEQKAELQSFLQWNYRPENREYLYDYYRDNCSTRVRDALDRVLGGQLRAATAQVPTGTTYRWHSRRLLAGEPVIYSGLEAGLGPAADRPISAWEEMFLPSKVQERVRELRVAGAAGEPVPLVASEQLLYEAVERAPEAAAPPRWTLRYLLIGLALGALLLGLGTAAAHSAPARFGFAALGALWALVVGTGGVLLLGLWALTNHTVAYANENLLQLNPLALPLVLLLPALAYGARWAAGAARALTLGVAALSLLGFLLQALPGLDQVNGEIIALVLPGHLALAWVVHRLGRREEGAGSRPAPPARGRAAGEPTVSLPARGR